MEIGARLEDLGLELPVLHCPRLYLVCIMLCIMFEHTILLVAFRSFRASDSLLDRVSLGAAASLKKLAEKALRF